MPDYDSMRPLVEVSPPTRPVAGCVLIVLLRLHATKPANSEADVQVLTSLFSLTFSRNRSNLALASGSSSDLPAGISSGLPWE